MNEAPVYYMTKRVTTINGHTVKINLGKEVPYEVGTIIYVYISSTDGSLHMGGSRKIMKSGTSKAVTLPKWWGFKKGDLVYISVSSTIPMFASNNTVTTEDIPPAIPPYFGMRGGLS